MKLEFLTARELVNVLDLENNLTLRERLLVDRLSSALDAVDDLDDIRYKYHKMLSKQAEVD